VTNYITGISEKGEIIAKNAQKENQQSRKEVKRMKKLNWKMKKEMDGAIKREQQQRAMFTASEVTNFELTIRNQDLEMEISWFADTLERAHRNGVAKNESAPSL
jgi:hypothetical protein